MASFCEAFLGKRFVCYALTIVYSIYNTIGQSIPYYGTRSKKLTFYGRTTPTATGVRRLRIRAYYDYGYGRTTTTATGVRRLRLRACYAYGYGRTSLRLRAYYAYGYGRTTLTATGVSRLQLRACYSLRRTMGLRPVVS